MRPPVWTAVAICGLQLLGCSKAIPGDSKKSDKPQMSEIDHCQVSIDTGMENMVLEWRITDSQLIRRLIDEPLSKAIPNSNPDRFLIKGFICIKRKDGSDYRVVLFHPWGQIKVGDKYSETDLSLLRRTLHESLTTIQHSLE